MVNRLSLTRSSSLVVAALGFATSAPLLAQSIDSSRVLEELTVTAQKREELLQNVPISMSVVSMSTLRDLNIFEFQELAELIPSSSVNRGLQTGSIRLRGVGPSAFTVSAPESVAIFVDQFPQSRAGSVLATLHDVERVAVLRGPQGTLYGQNAPVGVYNISTRKPDTQALNGYVQSSYSAFDGDDDREIYDIRGAVNLPLVRNALGLRLAGVYRDDEGFATAENPASSFDAAGGRDLHALRARLLWLPGSRSQVMWTSNLQDVTSFPISGNFDGQVPGTGGNNPPPAQQTRFEDRAYWGEERGEVDGKLQDTGIHWVYEADRARLDVLASYQSFETDARQNRRAFIGGSDNFQFEANYDIASLEVRASAEGPQFDYVAGVYIYDKSVDVDVDLLLGSTNVLGIGQERTETWAAFGNVKYHINPQWDIALGLRIDTNDVSADYDTGFAAAPRTNLDDRNAFDHVSWSAKLLWYPVSRATVYLALDNATKQGGYNPLVSTAEVFGEEFPQISAIVEENLRYDEETTTAFELGVKGRALRNRLRYNIAVYYQRFDDYQLTHQGNREILDSAGDFFTNVITNADEVATRGMEFSATYLFGRRWTLNHRLAYFDADILEWDRRFCSPGESTALGQVYCAVEDMPLNNLSKWGANTRLRYQRPWRKWNLYALLNWSWRSEVDEVRLTDQFVTDKSRFNLSVGARSAAHNLDVRLWAKNLTDTDLNQSPGLQRNGDRSQPDAFRGGYTRGREVGLTVSYRF